MEIHFKCFFILIIKLLAQKDVDFMNSKDFLFRNDVSLDHQDLINKFHKSIHLCLNQLILRLINHGIFQIVIS